MDIDNSDMYNRVLSNPIDNLAVGFTSKRTRTDLISNEYNRALYTNVRALVPNPLMRELLITPKGWNKVDSESKKLPFSPHKHNWRRSTKVPALFLNCTTLNTVIIIAHAPNKCLCLLAE